MRSLTNVALALALPVTLALAACTTNPYTGRSQAMMVSESQETQLGVQAFQEMKKTERISNDAALNEPLRRVGGAIAAVADQMRADEGQPPYQWEFTVIDDSETVNAWCLPGGKIGFYTGIYPILEDEAGMAMVMGHEVCHALLRHGAERMSHGMLASLGMEVASAIAGGGESGDMVMAALGLGTQVGIMLPFSRDHETEADRLGLMLAAQAGYDPRAAVKVWQNMASQGGGRPPEILSTHPDPVNRIANMQQWMPDALAIYERSVKRPNNRLPTPPKSPPKAKAEQPASSSVAPQPTQPRRRPARRR